MALLVLIVVAGLAALFLIPGSTPRMDIRRYPNSLAVLEQVPVNDTRQWILIRSESVTNPVVLFVHGGPRHVVAHADEEEHTAAGEVLHRCQLGSAARREILRRRPC